MNCEPYLLKNTSRQLNLQQMVKHIKETGKRENRYRCNCHPGTPFHNSNNEPNKKGTPDIEPGKPDQYDQN